MLGSHNSGTGEHSHISWRAVFLPFCRCQHKSVVEQYKSGVRFFDIRVRKRGDRWVFAHGLWESRYGVEWSLLDLNLMAINDSSLVYIRIFYEGTPSSAQREEYLKYVEHIHSSFSHIRIVYAGIKKPWEYVAVYDQSISIRDKYHVLNLSKNKKALFPCPIFWWLFRTKEQRMMEEGDTVVNLCDFV